MIDLVAAAIRESAANAGPKGGDPNPSHQQQLERIDGRRTGPELTRDQVHPDPLVLDIEVLPSSQDDPTDELHEIEEALGIDPNWQPNLQPED